MGLPSYPVPGQKQMVQTGHDKQNEPNPKKIPEATSGSKDDVHAKALHSSTLLPVWASGAVELLPQGRLQADQYHTLEGFSNAAYEMQHAQ